MMKVIETFGHKLCELDNKFDTRMDGFDANFAAVKGEIQDLREREGKSICKKEVSVTNSNLPDDEATSKTPVSFIITAALFSFSCSFV